MTSGKAGPPEADRATGRRAQDDVALQGTGRDAGPGAGTQLERVGAGRPRHPQGMAEAFAAGGNGARYRIGQASFTSVTPCCISTTRESSPWRATRARVDVDGIASWVEPGQTKQNEGPIGPRRRAGGIARRRVLAALAVLGIAGWPRPARAFTVVDPTGRTLDLPAAPARIVSLVPSVTEILFAIGAQDQLVGVTDFCDFPAGARAKPRVGGMLAPSLEAIVARRPDVVVATPSGNREETVAAVGRLRIPVYLVNPESVDDVLGLVARLGELTGRVDAARALAASLRRRIQDVEARVSPFPRPRVLYVLWPEPLIVPGRGAVISGLIRLAGGDSVTADVSEAYPRYSAEAAIAKAPQVIFVARHGSEGAAGGEDLVAREKWQRFQGLPAIRRGRLYAVDGNLLHRYGPRMVDGLEMLARLTHPEAFTAPAAAARPAAPGSAR
ncbi:MAG TPA: cobalamin-binding protein [Candidatus Binatia bacterium]|nr:cobalamin-binding protein [Candidatus Binatia bacterium]